MKVVLVVFTLSALHAVVYAKCGLDDFRCCLTEFLRLVSPSGIHLTEQNAAAACTVREETVECLDMFEIQCAKEAAEELQKTINETKEYINLVCPPNSDFMAGVKTNENCFINSSGSFQACYNKTLLPKTNTDDDEMNWTEGCCEYKNLRNCAVEVVENSCGVAASQLIHEELIHINGAGFESSCGDLFDQCENFGFTLKSSAAAVLFSTVVTILLALM